MPSRSTPAKATSELSAAATAGRTTRWLLLAGIVGPVLLIVAVAAAGSTWPGFEHRVQNISDLGGTEAPHPLVLNGMLVLVGALVTAFAVGLRRAESPVTAFGTLLVGSFGLSLAIQGATPCTPGCAGGTVPDLIHGAAALLGIVAVAWAAILTAMHGAGGSDPYRRGSWVCGVAVPILLGAWLVAAGVDPDRLHAGSYQRLLFATALTWLALTAVVAARKARTAQAARTAR